MVSAASARAFPRSLTPRIYERTRPRRLLFTGRFGPMDDQALRELKVVIPSLHWRYSGVTATNRMIAPRVARVVATAWIGRDAPEGLARLTFGDLLRLRGLPPSDHTVRIWHAR